MVDFLDVNGNLIGRDTIDIHCSPCEGDVVMVIQDGKATVNIIPIPYDEMSSKHEHSYAPVLDAAGLYDMGAII